MGISHAKNRAHQKTLDGGLEPLKESCKKLVPGKTAPQERI
jgi:hypothetical protein